MNSSFDTTVARRQLRHFRHYLVWEPAAHQQRTSRFGERGISTPTYWGLLKQPDNQKRARDFSCIRGTQVIAALTVARSRLLPKHAFRMDGEFPGRLGVGAPTVPKTSVSGTSGWRAVRDK